MNPYFKGAPKKSALKSRTVIFNALALCCLPFLPHDFRVQWFISHATNLVLRFTTSEEIGFNGRGRSTDDE